MNARDAREKLNLSQEKFASLLDVSVQTLRSWEAGRRNPSGSAKTLLKLVAADPEHARQTLEKDL